MYVQLTSASEKCDVKTHFRYNMCVLLFIDRFAVEGVSGNTTALSSSKVTVKLIIF